MAKVKVHHANGTVEILHFGVGTWRCEEGPFLNRIIGPTGFTHFFTHDGEYDGWGAAVSETPVNADDVIRVLDGKREISPPPEGE